MLQFGFRVAIGYKVGEISFLKILCNHTAGFKKNIYLLYGFTYLMTKFREGEISCNVFLLSIAVFKVREDTTVLYVNGCM